MKGVNIYTKHTKGGMLHHDVAQQLCLFKPGLVLLSSAIQFNNMHQFCFNPVSRHWAVKKTEVSAGRHPSPTETLSEKSDNGKICLLCTSKLQQSKK